MSLTNIFNWRELSTSRHSVFWNQSRYFPFQYWQQENLLILKFSSVRNVIFWRRSQMAKYDPLIQIYIVTGHMRLASLLFIKNAHLCRWSTVLPETTISKFLEKFLLDSLMNIWKWKCFYESCLSWTLTNQLKFLAPAWMLIIPWGVQGVHFLSL